MTAGDSWLFFDDPGSTLVLTFGGLRTGARQFDLVSSTSTAGVKRAHVIDARGIWYQRGVTGFGTTVESSAVALKEVVQSTGATRVVTIGVSAGGFAALLFGALIEADVALAFSPQTIATPEARRELGDWRWLMAEEALKLAGGPDPDYADLVPVLERTVAPGQRVVVHYAEDDPLDVAHAERIAGVPRVELIPHAQGGHSLIRILRDSGKLQQTLDDATGAQRTPAPAAVTRSVDAVDVVILAEGDPGWARVTWKGLTSDASPRSVRIVTARALKDRGPSEAPPAPAQPIYLGTYAALRDAIEAGGGDAVLVLRAGVDFDPGSLEALASELTSDAPVVAGPDILAGAGRRVGPQPAVRLGTILGRPEPPPVMLFTRAAYDACGGLDVEFGPHALWELYIRLVAATPDHEGVLSAASASIHRRAAAVTTADDVVAHRIELGLATEEDAPNIVIEVVGYCAGMHANVIARHKDLLARFGGEAIIDAAIVRAMRERSETLRRYQEPAAERADLRDPYLDALRQSLTGASAAYPYHFAGRPTDENQAAIFDELRGRGLELVTRRPPKHDLVDAGGGWPVAGLTMIGEQRLRHLQHAVETVIAEGVPGDLIETGVWRGGATILMRAVLQAHGVKDRRVWVADSFQGVPPPDPDRYPEDADDRLHEQPPLAVSLDEVQANFEAHGLLDDQVRFLPGWFRDTLPTLAGETWAVVRLDGDLYESTIQGLEYLYPQLSPGGFLIVDDFGAMASCRKAVEDFRESRGITEPIESIDWTGVFWRKGSR